MRGQKHMVGLVLILLIGVSSLGSCSKRCKDWVMLPYPEQLHAYMRPYKPGSWWVYESTTGLRDSVYLTEYRETREAVNEGDRPCFGMPTTEFALRTDGMDTTGMIYVTYALGDGGNGTSVGLSAIGYQGWTLMRFGFHVQEGLTGVLVQDTFVNTTLYENSLRIDRKLHNHARQLESVLLAKDIGIVGYITETDTFSLSAFHIP